MENRKNRVGIDTIREEIKNSKVVVNCDIANQQKDSFIIDDKIVTFLDSEALHVYCFLLSKCEVGSNKCSPTREDISNATGINKNKITSILDFLEYFGLVKIRRGGGFTNRKNVYYLYSIKEIKDR
ncbi:hypothetical protein P7A62_00490 [Clostridium perfringens]|nr:hypothetical protein [Clostridium perfringens]